MGKKMESHDDAVQRAKEAEEIAKARLAEIAEAERRRAEMKVVPPPVPDPPTAS